MPPSESPAREPDTGDLVMALARRVRRAYADALAAWQVTPSQSRALRVLSGSPGGMRPSVLAEELRIAPRSATEVADALVARGWVQRAADPTDRRATIIELTREGAEKAESTHEVYRQLVSELFETLSDEDQDELLRLMGLLREELRHR